ncbi:MAG: hypothetical protein H7329_03390 [Opitutaceae bacterium]|nr:hypothetical protein [Cytophagales bacterium]
MKKLIQIFCLILVTHISRDKCRVGVTEENVKKEFNSKVFETCYTKEDNVKYITCDVGYGSITSYFNPETKLSEYCLLIANKSSLQDNFFIQ